MCSDDLVDSFIAICDEIKLPIALDKTEWVTELIVFLGMLLDTRNKLKLIPLHEKGRAIQALKELLAKRTVTVLRLQQITGFLNHIGKAVFPSHAFTRRYYAKTAGLALKPYHHINVDLELKSDTRMWLTFLTKDPHALCRPFVDLSQVLLADEIISSEMPRGQIHKEAFVVYFSKDGLLPVG